MTTDPARPPTRGELAFYRFVRGVVVIFSKLFWRLEVHGAEHIPATGPFVLSPVHRSNIDTPIVSAVTHRRLRYMGKDSMWKVALAGKFFTALGGFPVVRGTADRDALRTGESVLRAGEPLVVFPEGTRRTGPEVVGLFDGPAFLAGRTGAPIVPVGIGGSEWAMPKGARMLRPVKLTIVVGEPLPAPVGEDGKRPSRRAVAETTEKLRIRVQELFDDAQRRAGREVHGP